MRKLICRCPETQLPVDLELYTDCATLARIWSNSLRFQCPHCGAEHETNVGAAWLEDTLGGISTARAEQPVGRDAQHVDLTGATRCRVPFSLVEADGMSCGEFATSRR